MNEHPHDALPALALGALDADEASQVIGHVAACPSCRDDAEAWGAVVAMLPYAVPPKTPDTRVKRRLLAMIEASAAAVTADPARRARRSAPSWMGVVAACSLALALVFGLLFANARQRADQLATQLAQRDQALQQIRGEMERDQQALNAQLTQRDRALQQIRSQVEQERKEMLFVLAATDQPLAATETSTNARGVMYMQPGHNHAVLFLQGLKSPEGGKVYQFWLAKGDTQIPSATFTVAQDGTALVVLDAPAPVNEYAQVMVTVEPAGGSQKPSDQVVLQANLST
jgi:anti-sigma-K factor RskA/putative zinc finger protein